MIRIDDLQLYEGQDPRKGVLYRLDEGMALEGRCDFTIFGEVMIGPVRLSAGRYQIDLRTPVVLENASQKPAGVLLHAIPRPKPVHKPYVPLPEIHTMADPDMIRFKAWAIELGLLPPDGVEAAPEPVAEPEVPFDDEADEDEFDPSGS